MRQLTIRSSICRQNRRHRNFDAVRRVRFRALLASWCWLGVSVFSAPLIHGQDLSKFDLSTNDGVNAAREAIAGKPLDDHSKRCIQRDPGLPRIVVVGGFAFDYGCRLQGAFVSSRYLTADDEAFSRTALEALGWKAADRLQRENLAQAWVARGLMAFLTAMADKNEDFAGHSFQAPQTVTRTDGNIAVKLWIRLPSGRVRGTRYELREYRFSSDGNLTGNITQEGFTATRN